MSGETRGAFATEMGAVELDERIHRSVPPTRTPAAWRRRVASVLRHEWTVASACAVLLAAVMTWPTLRNPTRTLPKDLKDPALDAWQMAWSGHALRTDPTALWHSNVFYPERYSFAFSDTLLGYAPAGLIGTGDAAAILRYNLVYVFAFALAFLGAYALIRQLGAGRAGAALGAAAYAFAPWRWAQANHLHVLSSGGIVLALAMLARGHGWSLRDGYRPDSVCPGWALAGWLVAAWQITLGFGIGLPFAYMLAVFGMIATVRWARSSRADGRSDEGGLRGWLASRLPVRFRLLRADLVGVAAFVATTAFMAYPYFQVIALHPQARRQLNEVALYSTPWWGFFTAPAESLTWGAYDSFIRAGLRTPAETAVLGGYLLYVLAGLGLFVSVWSVRWRLALAGGAITTAFLAMGVAAPLRGWTGYVLLYWALPGWDALRTPGRLVLWTTLLLGVLAAGAVCAGAERLRRYAAARDTDRHTARHKWVVRLALIVPLSLVLIEGRPALAYPQVPSRPAAVHAAQAPLLVLPSDVTLDQTTMLSAVDRFPAMVNGYSGFIPQSQSAVRSAAEHFPDQASVELLRHMGVKTVIVLKREVVGTPYETAARRDIADLHISRDENADTVVYRL
jgi:hypothetical protein